MNQFIYDMIHMTEGEKFIKYWWLWLIIVIIVIVLARLSDRPIPPPINKVEIGCMNTMCLPTKHAQGFSI